MVSKNNFKHKMQDEAKRVPHYGLRKLSVGVASVLLSTTLFFGVSAHADTTNTDTQTSTDETSQESNAAGIANQSAKSVTLNGVSSDKKSNSSNNMAEADQKNTQNLTETSPNSTISSIKDNKAEVVTNLSVVKQVNSQKVSTDIQYQTVELKNRNLNVNDDQNQGVTTILAQASDGDDSTSSDNEANEKTGYIYFVDNVTGKQVGQYELKGKVGDSIDISEILKLPSAYPDGYIIVNGSTTKSFIDITNDGIPSTTVKVEKYSYDYGIVRRIIINRPDGKTEQYDQVVKYQVNNRIFIVGMFSQAIYRVVHTLGIRNADVDATGELNYDGTGYPVNSDNPASWEKFEKVPKFNGYTASQDSVEAEKTPIQNFDELKNLSKQKPTASTKDGIPLYRLETVTINYTANDQNTHIIYQDTSGNKIKIDTVSGKPGQTVDTKSSVPAGWEIADSSAVKTVPKTITFTDGKTVPDTIITIEHIVTIVTPDTPKTDIPTGPVPGNPDNPYPSVDQSSLKKKTVTRTIYAKYPSGDITELTKQQVEFQTTVAVDHVNGNVTTTGFKTKDAKTGEWTNDYGTWDEYTVPSVAGYTASQATVAEQDEITSETQDVQVTINYTPDQQTGKISYVDPDGKEIANTPLTGAMDATIPVNPQIPTGWVEVSGQNISKTVKVPAGTIPTVTVKIQHGTVTVDPTDPKTPSDVIPNDGDKKFPKGVAKDDLNKTITRTITVNLPGGPKTVTQEAKLTRKATVDMVDGSVKYDDWTIGNWAEYDAPVVPGYTASQGTVASQGVTSETQDTQVTINYTANNQTTHIIYKDTEGKVVKTDTVNGKTDQTVDTNSTVPACWKISGKSTVKTVPSTITFTGSSTPDTFITIEHAHNPVKPDQPVQPGDKTPDGKTTIDGGHKADLNQTITRTVNITDPHTGNTTTTTQTAHITRTGDLDEVSGHVTYGSWTTDDKGWVAVDVPNVPGYTPSQPSVDAVVVKNGQKDQTINITYTANDGTQTINYVDKDGKKVGDSQVINGKTDQKIKVTPQVPVGWVLTKDSGMPTDVTIKPSDTPINVKIEHGTHLVTPDGKTTIDGGHEADLTKTITRTINVTDPSGKTTTTTQTARLTQTGTVDDVTGEVTYTPWTTDNTSWTDVDVPSVSGYTPSQKHVGAVTVDINTQSQTININYTLDPTNTASNEYVSDQTANGQNATNGAAATTATPSNNVAGTQSNNQKKQLPQTGNKHSSMAALGLGLMSFLGLYGFHKKEDED